MAKLIFRIIALVVLVVGFVLVVGAKVFVPEHKYKAEERERRALKIRIIGFIVCAFSALIFLVVSLF